MSADGCACVFVLPGVFLFVLLCVHIWEPCKIRDLCNFFSENKALDSFLATLYTSFLSVHDKKMNQQILKVKQAMRVLFLMSVA